MNTSTTIITSVAALLAFVACGSNRTPTCLPGYAMTPSGSCEPDERCYKTDECRVKGLCTTWGEQCVAASERDCVPSENCRNFGACQLVPQQTTYKVGTCRASEEGCRSSGGCAEYGRCTLNRSTGSCAVGSDADCAGSRICREEKKCSASRFKKADGSRANVLSCQMQLQ